MKIHPYLRPPISAVGGLVIGYGISLIAGASPLFAVVAAVNAAVGTLSGPILKKYNFPQPKFTLISVAVHTLQVLATLVICAVFGLAGPGLLGIIAGVNAILIFLQLRALIPPKTENLT